MSINYCGLLTSDDHTLLAESKTGVSYYLRLMTYLNDIQKSGTTGKFEMNQEIDIHFIRATKVLFILIASSNITKDKPLRFMEHFVEIVLREFQTLDNITNVPGKITKYQHQEKLEENLNFLVRSFDTHIYDNKKIKNIQADVDDTKKEIKKQILNVLHESEDLNELLIKSEKIEIEARSYKENTLELKRKTQWFCNKWVIGAAIVLGVILIYAVISLIRCTSILVFWC